MAGEGMPGRYPFGATVRFQALGKYDGTVVADESELIADFTVVAGANGAGKSTLTRLGREAFQDAPVLDPDIIARSMQQTGISGGSIVDAGRTVLQMSEQLLNGCQSFLVETTPSGNTYFG
jgi:predicted ABC-type ATPase